MAAVFGQEPGEVLLPELKSGLRRALDSAGRDATEAEYATQMRVIKVLLASVQKRSDDLKQSTREKQSRAAALVKDNSSSVSDAATKALKLQAKLSAQLLKLALKSREFDTVSQLLTEAIKALSSVPLTGLKPSQYFPEEAFWFAEPVLSVLEDAVVGTTVPVAVKGLMVESLLGVTLARGSVELAFKLARLSTTCAGIRVSEAGKTLLRGLSTAKGADTKEKFRGRIPTTLVDTLKAAGESPTLADLSAALLAMCSARADDVIPKTKDDESDGKNTGDSKSDAKTAHNGKIGRPPVVDGLWASFSADSPPTATNWSSAGGATAMTWRVKNASNRSRRMPLAVTSKSGPNFVRIEKGQTDAILSQRISSGHYTIVLVDRFSPNVSAQSGNSLMSSVPGFTMGCRNGARGFNIPGLTKDGSRLGPGKKSFCVSSLVVSDSTAYYEQGQMKFFMANRKFYVNNLALGYANGAPAGQNLGNMDIGLILLYNRALSAEDLDKISSWAAEKFSIDLKSGGSSGGAAPAGAASAGNVVLRSPLALNVRPRVLVEGVRALEASLAGYFDSTMGPDSEFQATVSQATSTMRLLNAHLTQAVRAELTHEQFKLPGSTTETLSKLLMRVVKEIPAKRSGVSDVDMNAAATTLRSAASRAFAATISLIATSVEEQIRYVRSARPPASASGGSDAKQSGPEAVALGEMLSRFADFKMGYRACDELEASGATAPGGFVEIFSEFVGDISNAGAAAAISALQTDAKASELVDIATSGVDSTPALNNFIRHLMARKMQWSNRLTIAENAERDRELNSQDNIFRFDSTLIGGRLSLSNAQQTARRDGKDAGNDGVAVGNTPLTAENENNLVFELSIDEADSKSRFQVGVVEADSKSKTEFFGTGPEDALPEGSCLTGEISLEDAEATIAWEARSASGSAIGSGRRCLTLSSAGSSVLPQIRLNGTGQVTLRTSYYRPKDLVSVSQATAALATFERVLATLATRVIDDSARVISAFLRSAVSAEVTSKHVQNVLRPSLVGGPLYAILAAICEGLGTMDLKLSLPMATALERLIKETTRAYTMIKKIFPGLRDFPAVSSGKDTNLLDPETDKKWSPKLWNRRKLPDGKFAKDVDFTVPPKQNMKTSMQLPSSTKGDSVVVTGTLKVTGLGESGAKLSLISGDNTWEAKTVSKPQNFALNVDDISEGLKIKAKAGSKAVFVQILALRCSKRDEFDDISWVIQNLFPLVARAAGRVCSALAHSTPLDDVETESARDWIGSILMAGGLDMADAGSGPATASSVPSPADVQTMVKSGELQTVSESAGSLSAADKMTFKSAVVEAKNDAFWQHMNKLAPVAKRALKFVSKKVRPRALPVIRGTFGATIYHMGLAPAVLAAVQSGPGILGASDALRSRLRDAYVAATEIGKELRRIKGGGHGADAVDLFLSRASERISFLFELAPCPLSAKTPLDEDGNGEVKAKADAEKNAEKKPTLKKSGSESDLSVAKSMPKRMPKMRRAITTLKKGSKWHKAKLVLRLLRNTIRTISVFKKVVSLQGVTSTEDSASLSPYLRIQNEVMRLIRAKSNEASLVGLRSSLQAQRWRALLRLTGIFRFRKMITLLKTAMPGVRYDDGLSNASGGGTEKKAVKKLKFSMTRRSASLLVSSDGRKLINGLTGSTKRFQSVALDQKFLISTTKGVKKFGFHVEACVSNWVWLGVVSQQWVKYSTTTSYLGDNNRSMGYTNGGATGNTRLYASGNSGYIRSSNYNNKRETRFTSGAKIVMSIDFDKKEVSFSLNGRDLGTAMTFPPTWTEISPAVCIYQNGDKVSLFEPDGSAADTDTAASAEKTRHSMLSLAVRELGASFGENSVQGGAGSAGSLARRTRPLYFLSNVEAAGDKLENAIAKEYFSVVRSLCSFDRIDEATKLELLQILNLELRPQDMPHLVDIGVGKWLAPLVAFPCSDTAALWDLYGTRDAEMVTLREAMSKSILGEGISMRMRFGAWNLFRMLLYISADSADANGAEKIKEKKSADKPGAADALIAILLGTVQKQLQMLQSAAKFSVKLGFEGRTDSADDAVTKLSKEAKKDSKKE